MRTPVGVGFIGKRARSRVALGLALALCALVLVPASAVAAYRQKYGFVHTFAIAPPTPDFQPYGMTFGANGDLFMATHSNYISEFTTQGVSVASQLGSTVTTAFEGGTEGLSIVDNVAILGNTMWVADKDRGIAKFATDGTFTGVSTDSVGIVGDGALLSDIQGVAVDASGCVYVSDHGSANNAGFRVSKYTSDGTYVTSFGDTGTTPLASASSIAIGPDFNVYVADWQAGKVRYFVPKPGRTKYIAAPGWMNETAFDSPTSVSVDRAGNIFVVDSGYGSITKLDATGRAIAHWGKTSLTTSDNGEFKYPFAVAIGANGNVFVDDRDGLTVQEFQLLDFGPKTSASANVSVKKGKKVTFQYKVDEDVSSKVTATLKVYKGSSLKKTIPCGSVTQGSWHFKTWACKLAKGSYTWKVYAKDAAGHSQANIASKKLKVK